MRSLEETVSRWDLTTQRLTTLGEFKESVRLDASGSPCTSGLRSVCWKTFLLFQEIETEKWPQVLADSRSAYTSLRGHLLRFIDNPDEIGSALDPLDEDQNSPWNTLRQDDEIRAEIFQDVERCMPEEPYFRRAETQRMLLDILFVFCKINQDVGYRQGMHELLAPVLWVIDEDSFEFTNGTSATNAELDPVMKKVLDRSYVEHDAFTLLSLIMRSAKSFYELAGPAKPAGSLPSGSNTPQHESPIVERSNKIHQVYLTQVDPELSKHLTDIEVLPQIFLIRWIRLLFGREFPFSELLGLWDVIFAEDPELDLVDLVCVAMLLRIRWQLIESNYSFALMLLLKYPSLAAPNGPETLVDDAIFLRDHLSTDGGASIISKYSGKLPSSNSSRPSTPLGTNSTTSPRQKLQRTKSPLASPARFLQQQGGVSDLFQGAARGLLDRGERLGINQAVRDAVEEAKKNMQTLQASRSNSFKSSSGNTRWSLDEGRKLPSSQSLAAASSARNRQLADMLGKASLDLRATAVSKSEDKDTYIKAMELAIAKIEFVKIYLEDSSMPLPSETQEKSTSDPLQTTTKSVSNSKEKIALAQPRANKPDEDFHNPPKKDVNATKSIPPIETEPDKALSRPTTNDFESDQVTKQPVLSKDSLSPTDPSLARPSAPLPTRSSIAQSNFAWMLEPDTPSGPSSPPKSSSPFLKSGRRPTSGASREKAAFLFGEEGDDPLSGNNRFPVTSDADEGFNMGTLRANKTKS